MTNPLPLVFLILTSTCRAGQSSTISYTHSWFQNSPAILPLLSGRNSSRRQDSSVPFGSDFPPPRKSSKCLARIENKLSVNGGHYDDSGSPKWQQLAAAHRSKIFTFIFRAQYLATKLRINSSSHPFSYELFLVPTTQQSVSYLPIWTVFRATNARVHKSRD